MTERDEFRTLLHACRRRDSAAAAELVRRYLPHVRAAVRRRLAVGLRPRFDSHDFAQDVWLSFFRAAIDRLELDDETALIAYLSQMARLKVLEEHRHQSSQKIGFARDTRLDEAAPPAGREPTPSAVAVAADEWERMTGKLGEREIQMIRMIRDGHTHAATAAAFGVAEKTVQRLVRHLQGHGSKASPPS
jgi:RNA polymerase sigma factor (sigma-70 family)